MMVWVISPNLTERALVVAALEELGLAANGFETLGELLEHGQPDTLPNVVVLDSGTVDLSLFSVLRERAPRAATVLLGTQWEKAISADYVLRRPISIGELTEKIHSILGGFGASASPHDTIDTH